MEPGSKERGILDRSMFKMHYSKLLIISVVEHNFYLKKPQAASAA
jgi:hypothetical protein